MRTHLLLSLVLGVASSSTDPHLDEGMVCNDSPSGKWHCRSEADCRGSAEALRKGWKPEVCSFKNKKMIICCPPSLNDFWSQAGGNSSDKPHHLSWSGSWDKLPSGGWKVATTARTTAGSTGQTAKPVQNSSESILDRTALTLSRTPAASKKPGRERFSQQGYSFESAVAKAQEKCRDYAAYVWKEEAFVSIPGEEPEKKEYCGRATKQLVFGGKDAEAYEFPHMARIGYGDESNINYGCSGSLISEKFILSAAHCSVVEGREAAWANLGDCDLTTDSDVPKEEVVTVRIVERIVHPDFNLEKNWYDDIALFKVEDLKLGIYIRPACLNTRKDRKENSFLVTGWGLTKSIPSFTIDIGRNGEATVLQKMELKVIPNDQCNSSYSRLSSKDRAKIQEGIRSQGMVCAEGELGKAICDGDSGGPLQALAPDCMYDIVGVTSFGYGCKSTYPGVYTNVVDYLPWIVQVVWG